MVTSRNSGSGDSTSASHLDEVNVFTEPKNAKVWLDMLDDSERLFEQWNNTCDEIDLRYASLDRLNTEMRDKQFQMFWANMQVLAPSVYARPPVPVVVPKFKDRRPVYTAASEVAERCSVVAFDLTYIHNALMLLRDDFALHGRGVLWCRHERSKANGKPEKVCIEHKQRRDFLHDPARCWYEVQWVAAASYLTREEAKKRFVKFSGDAYLEAEYKIDKETRDVGAVDDRERAKIWEVWHRGLGLVVWVAEGVDVLLDEDKPHLDLQSYFPCPQPAYGTTQPGSLIPIPDYLYYRDQLEELNQLTGRIHALANAIRVKGFYPSGGNEIAEAIESALKMESNSRIMVPITNWAAFGGSKEVVVWLPIDQIANTINVLVTLRKQIIEDIYQVMGLSDIMRGATDPNETLGAQQLKMQSGSTRIKDKQGAIAQISRDCVLITTEIITEKFADDTIKEMSQSQLPTEMEKAMQLQQLQQQLAQAQMMAQQALSAASAPPPAGATGPGAAPPPGAMPPGPPTPQPGAQEQQQQQQMQLMMLQQQMQSLQSKPTWEQVLRFLRDNRARNFVLDIETDSTIQLDEQKEKQQRGEFLAVLGNLLPQIGQMVSAMPAMTGFAGEILKFGVAPFRVGRQLDNSIDDAVSILQTMASQMGNDPNAQKNKESKQDAETKAQVEREKMQWQTGENEKERQIKLIELQSKNQLEQEKANNERQVALMEFENSKRESEAKIMQINAQIQADRERAAMDQQNAQTKILMDQQKQQIVRQGMNEKLQVQREGAAMKQQSDMRNQQMKERQFNQGMAQRDQQFRQKQAMNPRGTP